MKRGPTVFLVEPVCPYCERRFTSLARVESHMNDQRCPSFPPLGEGDCANCAGLDARAPGPTYAFCVRCRPVAVVAGVKHELDHVEAGGDLVLAELLRQAGACDGRHGPLACRRELVKESYRLGRERALPAIKEALRP